MGRSKNSPKKRSNSMDVSGPCMDYIPVIKKRKRKIQNNKSEILFNISLSSNSSTKLYLGEILLGPTNNIFPQDYEKVKISFRFSEDIDQELCDDDVRDAIIVVCDTILVVIKSITDTHFIKELVKEKVFSFDFVYKDENVYLKIYFGILPLPHFSPKLGNTIKTLFSMVLNGIDLLLDDSFTSSHKKNHGSSEISKLYEKLSEMRKTDGYIKNEIAQHIYLRPTLRHYQEKSVHWMLHREHIQDNCTDKLHPLYTEIKLESNFVIYFDKYTGFVTSEKPIISPNSKGGILADEMGLGKTVEVLACILLNPKIEESNKNSDESEPVAKKATEAKLDESDENSDTESEPIAKSRTKNRRILDSDDDSDTDFTPKISKQPKKLKIKVPLDNDNIDEHKILNIPENWVKPSSRKSVNKVALEMWYNSILSGMSTVNNNINENPNRISVQCICGSNSEDDAIKCTKCPKYQHKKCLGYKKSLGKYMCPQCWIDEPLLESKATLIVTPVSLKTQWCKEICNHVKGNIKILQYEGASAVSVYPTDLKEYDIVLTTYAVLQNELRLTQNGQPLNLRKERKYSAPGSPLTRLNWWRLCLDEAQAVEMPGRLVSEMARKITAVHRWAVTGTPISKNISDLYGLIDYLQISPYNDDITWKKILYEPYFNGNEKPLLDFLFDVLWRTAKKDVTDQINIPKQTYLEHTLEFSAVEKYFYKREHELISNNFLSKVRKFDLSLHLENLDKSTLKKLLAPLLTLRHTCTHPNTVRGRYLATKKQVTSMKELLSALILKNTNDSEDCLRLIISSLNGMAGIYLLLDNPQEAINRYREVLQLATRFSGERDESKLNIDKPQVIHTMYNLAEVLDTHTPDQPTLRDANLRSDREDLEKKYMEKFIVESYSAFDSFNTIMSNVEKMQNSFVLKNGQWYSDGLNWIFINGHFEELHSKIESACDRACVNNTLRATSERTMLQLIYRWDEDLSDLRSELFQTVEDLYNYEKEGEQRIVVKEDLVTEAMNCHLRPQKKGKQPPKCPVCLANDTLKKYEGRLFGMIERQRTFEDMSLQGAWKPTLQELVLKAILVVLKSKKSKPEFIKDGQIHVAIIDNIKKEFKELRRLWTFLDQQICAKDELDICKVRLQLKTENETVKVNSTLKNLNYKIESRAETIHLLSVHELGYQMALLDNDVKQHSVKLEKLLGTQSYLDNLRKQQYEGQSPDPCPICKNALEQHWSILSCGHSYCLECIQILLEQSAGDHIQCSICRNKQKYQDVSYIKAGGNTTDDNDAKTIKGNYSTKIEAVIRVLLGLKDENPDVKVLLFSSWITILKSLKNALNENSISCGLGQSGTLDSRITSFKDPSKKIMVLLLPINLGSKGLNLVEATHVILVEPVLNPADELQAIGRISRIGQTKATFVHKFLITNTIEENIHQATTSNAEHWEKSRVTLQHLVDLFHVAAVSEPSTSSEVVVNEIIEDVSLNETQDLEPSGSIIEIDEDEIDSESNNSSVVENSICSLNVIRTSSTSESTHVDDTAVSFESIGIDNDVVISDSSLLLNADNTGTLEPYICSSNVPVAADFSSDSVEPMKIDEDVSQSSLTLETSLSNLDVIKTSYGPLNC